MGNWSARFVRPGTQRIEDDAPPMARRDVGTTHSADIQDRSNRNDSLAAEGWDCYNCAQRGAETKAKTKAEEAVAVEDENEDVQLPKERNEMKAANTRPRQLFASTELFGEAASPDAYSHMLPDFGTMPDFTRFYWLARCQQHDVMNIR